MPEKTEQSRLCAVGVNFLGLVLIVSAITRGNDGGVSTALLSHAKAMATTATASARESMCGELVKTKCEASVKQALADHAAKYNATNQEMLTVLLERLDKSDKANAERDYANRDAIVTKIEQVNTTLYNELVTVRAELEKLGSRINSTAVLVVMPFIAHNARNWAHAYMIWVPFYYCHFVGGMNPFSVITLCVGILFMGAGGVPKPLEFAAAKVKSCLCERGRTHVVVAQTPPSGPAQAPVETVPQLDPPAPAYEEPAPMTTALRYPAPSLVVCEPMPPRRRLVLPHSPEHTPDASDNE